MHNIHDSTMVVEVESEPCETAEEVELGPLPFSGVGEELSVRVNRPTVVHAKPGWRNQVGQRSKGKSLTCMKIRELGAS